MVPWKVHDSLNTHVMLLERKIADPRIFISTGDHSGDMYAGRLIQEISARIPECTYFGLGGPKMEKLGFRSLVPISEISLVGFSEVIPKLVTFIRLLGQIRESLRSEKPDLVILIDYPGLNLRIARIAKELGIPVLYYIAPQLWAWGKRRVSSIKKYIDRVAVIMPFEVEYYRMYDIKVDYVGHPIIETLLLEEKPETHFTSMGIDCTKRILGILPGVRKNEIGHLLPPLSTIAEKLKLQNSDVEALVSLPGNSTTLHATASLIPYRGDSHALIANSDCLLTKSGTTVLEAAVLGTPMIVCYRLSWLNYLLARMFIETRYISLVNLLMDNCVVPEFVQGEVNHQNIIPLVEELLDYSSDRRVQMIERFNEVREKLGTHKTSAEVATMAMAMMGHA